MRQLENTRKNARGAMNGGNLVGARHPANPIGLPFQQNQHLCALVAWLQQRGGGKVLDRIRLLGLFEIYMNIGRERTSDVEYEWQVHDTAWHKQFQRGSCVDCALKNESSFGLSGHALLKVFGHRCNMRSFVG